MKLLLALLFLPLLAFGQAGSFRDPTLQFPATASAPLTAPTFVRTATNTATTGTTLTIAAFSVTGANPYLLVCVAERGSLTARTISGVTANGVAMANQVTTNFTDAKGQCAFYGLANPATGDIVVTLSGAINTSFTMVAILYNGSAAAGAAGADFSAAARTSVSIGLTSLASDVVVDGIIKQSGWTPGGSQTIRAQTTTGANTLNSTSPGSAGTTTMSWSSGAAGVLSQLAVVLHGL